jgi:hypothetical protein
MSDKLQGVEFWTFWISYMFIIFLDIIHRPVFMYKHCPVYISKHSVSETGFCLRLQVKPTQLGPIDRAGPYLRTESSLRNVVRFQ